MPNRPNSINEEAGLGENWVAIDAPPIIPGRNNPAPPPPPGTLFPQTPQYLQGSIPPGFQHDTSFVDTATLTPNAPKFSLMPLGIQGNPTTNAAIQSTASKSIPATASGKIELQVPSIFTPIDQTVDLPGPLVVALASEIENTVFAGPVSSAGSGGTDKTVSGTTVSANPYTLTATPSAYPEFAVCGDANWSGGSVGALDGTWTEFGWGGGEHLGYKSVASGNSVASITGGGPLGAIMTLFKPGSTTPAPIQNTNTSAGVSIPGTASLAFASPVTTGNMIFVQLTGNSGGSSSPVGSVIVTDSVGNLYVNLGTFDVVSSNRYFITQWCCINATGGSVTVTVTTAGGGSLTNMILGIVEFSSITKIVTTSIPTFRALVDADLPIVDVLHGGTGLGALPAYSVLLGEGTAVIGSATPGVAGGVLTSNGTGADPSFAALPTAYYQTVKQATVSKTQRPYLNFAAPITATDNVGTTSTDVAVPVFVGSGASHATGLVPDPGASAGTTKFLCEDATWKAAGGSGTALEINGVGVSSDKQFYFNGVADVVSVWGVQINGASG